MVVLVVPQQLTLVTLGARDRAELDRFYRSWGWIPANDSPDDATFFDLGGVRLAIWSAEPLRDEAAPGSPVPPPAWTSVSFAIHVAEPGAVDDTYDQAVAAGVEAIARPDNRDWGGRSAYVADPEGTRWAFVWSPDWPLPGA